MLHTVVVIVVVVPPVVVVENHYAGNASVVNQFPLFNHYVYVLCQTT